MILLIIAVSTTLSGCSGSVGGGAVLPTIDMSGQDPILNDGTTLATAYVMPAIMPAGTDGGLDDYLAQEPGIWEFNRLGNNEGVYSGGTFTNVYVGSFAYDTISDTWTVALNSTGASYTLDYDAANQIYTDCVAGGCAAERQFSLYGQGDGVSQYGTFGYAASFDSAGQNIGTYLTTGLITSYSSMPATGTATYNGVYQVSRVLAGQVDQSSTGEFTVTADFQTSNYSPSASMTNMATFSNGDTFAMGFGGFYGGPGARSTLIGGTANGTLYHADGSPQTFYNNGWYQGFVYGPNAEEIAGTLNVQNTTTGDAIAGGFWAKQ